MVLMLLLYRLLTLLVILTLPYTTLFRSHEEPRLDQPPQHGARDDRRVAAPDHAAAGGQRARRRGRGDPLPAAAWSRSEEHTSELQSHSDLVCRLLLENKKCRFS